MIIVFKIDCYQVLIKTTDPKFILLVKKDGTYVGVGLEVCQRNGIDDFFCGRLKNDDFFRQIVGEQKLAIFERRKSPTQSVRKEWVFGLVMRAIQLFVI